MNQTDQNYQGQIDQLRAKLGYHFVALAFAQSAADGFVVAWQFASGNLNNRYKRIVLQSGKGIAGLVFKTGKNLIMSDIKQDLKEKDLFKYPIIMSEQLRSLIAIPLFQYDRVVGVLLAGYRENQQIEEQNYTELLDYMNEYFTGFDTKELSRQ